MFGAAAPLHAADEVTITATLAGGYSPKAVTVPTGTTVTWKNGEAVPTLNTGPTGPVAIKHQVVTSDGSFDTGELTPGKTFTRTFNEAISLTYVCKIHPQLMSGSLTVEGAPVVPPATEKTIEIVERTNQTSSWGYSPNELTVTTGTTITWRNTGGTPHTVTADDGSFDSGTLAPGDTWVKTFKTAVAVTYKCTPHPWMTATLVVAKPGEKPPVVKPPKPGPNQGGNDAEPQPPAVIDSSDRDSSEPMTFDAQIVEGSISDPDSWTYAPEALTVRQGDTVVWSNEGSIDHTVTGGALDSGMIAPGATFSYTFDALGTISFACVPHPWMTGAVQVVEATAGAVDLPPAPAVPDPVVAPPGGGTGSTPGGSDGSGGSASGEGSGESAWSNGHIPLAAGTSVALLTIGFLFVLPLANDLRKQATQRSGLGDALEPTETTEPVEAPLIEPEIVAEPTPRPRATASRSSRTVVATARVSSTPRTAAPRARSKASTERIVLDDAPVRSSRVKDLAGSDRTR